MLVTLKTLQEDIFTVEIDPSQTVKYFKEKIERMKGDEFPAKNMKLMYAGKILVDSNRVSDYNVEEKKFVIVVVKKPKTPIVKEEEPESSTDTPRDRSTMTNGQRNSAEQNRPLCSEHESLVRHIIELGFTRAEVEEALCASYDNPDRAVEYLINGVLPSSSNNDDSDSEGRQRDPDDISDASDAHILRHISMSGPPSPDNSTMPNQERIMELFTEAMDECQNQTRAADSLLEEDHDLITQSFAEMEAADICRSSGASSSSTFMPPPQGMPDSSMFSPSDRMFVDSFSNPFHEAQALSFAGNLVDKDHEAIERLKQLGFSDHKAIEAYFVCERNENAAADYLFSQNFD